MAQPIERQRFPNARQGRDTRRPEKPKQDPTEQAFSLLSSSQGGWYSERRLATDTMDFKQVIERIHFRMESIARGNRVAPGRVVMSANDDKHPEQQTAEKMAKSAAAPMVVAGTDANLAFMAEKEKAAHIASSERLDQMTADLRQCEGIVKHFEAEAAIERAKLRKEMTPFFDEVYETSVMAQESFEQIANSRTPIETMMKRLKETDANMDAAAKVDVKGMLEEAQGDSRLFAQIALKTHPDLFGDMRGQTRKPGFFTRGGDDTARLNAYKAVEKYHPVQYQEAEMRLADAELKVAHVQKAFQAIDHKYRQVLEQELMRKLELYNGLMDDRLGLNAAEQAPELAEDAPQPDPQEAQQPELEQPQENPHGFKEAKRGRFMTEKQLAATQKRFAKAFPDAAKSAEQDDYVPMSVEQRAAREEAKAAREARKADRLAREAEEQAALEIPAVPEYAVRGASTLRADPSDRPGAEQEIVARTEGAPELRADPNDRPGAEQEIIARTEGAPELGAASGGENDLRADMPDDVPERTEGAPDLRATREMPEVIARGDASLAEFFSVEELKAGLDDLEVRLQKARDAQSKSGPVIGSRDFWDQGR